MVFIIFIIGGPLFLQMFLTSFSTGIKHGSNKPRGSYLTYALLFFLSIFHWLVCSASVFMFILMIFAAMFDLSQMPSSVVFKYFLKILLNFLSLIVPLGSFKLSSTHK